MKVAATTVGRKGHEGERQNGERLKVAELALEKAANLGADVIVLPGGFFTAHSSKAREAIADSFLSKAKQIGIAIVFGVDQEVKNPSTDGEILCKRRLLPYYGYVWSPSENIPPHCWQQRSSTSANQWYASEACCKEVRLLKIRDETLGVLMCGEIFNQRIRNALAKHSPRPKVVADVAHMGGVASEYGRA
jgi:hypothetical protein